MFLERKGIIIFWSIFKGLTPTLLFSSIYLQLHGWLISHWMTPSNSQKVISFNHCRCGRHSTLKPAHEKHYQSPFLQLCRDPSNPVAKLFDKLLVLPRVLHPSVNMASHLILFYTWYIGEYSCHSLGKFISLLHLINWYLPHYHPRYRAALWDQGYSHPAKSRRYIHV